MGASREGLVFKKSIFGRTPRLGKSFQRLDLDDDSKTFSTG